MLSSSYGKRSASVTSPVPIGVPFPYPINQILPLGFLNCSISETQTFVADIYPELYKMLGNTNVLPYYPATSTHIHIIKAKEQIENVEALRSLETVYAPCMPVGIPFPWISGQAYPAGTMLCNGQSFNVTEYPELALVYPDGKLPDLRGVALRGRDAGKGLDVDGADRTVGSYQDDAEQGHKHEGGVATATGSHVFGTGTTASAGFPYTASNSNFAGGELTSLQINDGTHGIPRISDETRMKNVAVDWLVFAKTMAYDLTVNNGNAVTLGGYAPSYFLPKSDVADVIKTSLTAPGSAPMGTCRAWVNFNGTTSPITIRGSMNVSSITDNGTGWYRINFITPMPDINYATIATGRSAAGSLSGGFAFEITASLSGLTRTANYVEIGTIDQTFNSSDGNSLSVAIFR